MTSSLPRSAPPTWGDWPPSPDRLEAAARRALSSARAIAAALAPNDDPSIEVWLTPAAHLGSIWFGPGSEDVAIGAILIPALGLGWLIVWNPETGGGRLWEHDARFPHEQERLRRNRDRLV